MAVTEKWPSIIAEIRLAVCKELTHALGLPYL